MGKCRSARLCLYCRNTSIDAPPSVLIAWKYNSWSIIYAVHMNCCRIYQLRMYSLSKFRPRQLWIWEMYSWLVNNIVMGKKKLPSCWWLTTLREHLHLALLFMYRGSSSYICTSYWLGMLMIRSLLNPSVEVRAYIRRHRSTTHAILCVCTSNFVWSMRARPDEYEPTRRDLMMWNYFEC